MRCVVCNNGGETQPSILCSKECIEKYAKEPWKYRSDIPAPEGKHV